MRTNHRVEQFLFWWDIFSTISFTGSVFLKIFFPWQIWRPFFDATRPDFLRASGLLNKCQHVLPFFSCPEQLNRTHCPSVCLTPLTIRVFTTLQSEPRDLWPLRHLIRMRKTHDMTKKIDKDKYKDKDILRTHPKSNPRDFWPFEVCGRTQSPHG